MITTEWTGKLEEQPKPGEVVARIGDAGPWLPAEAVRSQIQYGIVRDTYGGTLSIEPIVSESEPENAVLHAETDTAEA